MAGAFHHTVGALAIPRKHCAALLDIQTTDVWIAHAEGGQRRDAVDAGNAQRGF